MSFNTQYVPDAILDRIDRFFEEKDVTRRTELVEDLLRELKALSRLGVYEDAHYLAGYLLYMHPDKKEFPNAHSEMIEYLDHAIEKTRDEGVRALALLYRGHVEYDAKRIEAALIRFESISKETLDPYLALKVQEMQLCCRLRLNGVDSCLDAVQDFAEIALAHAAEDLAPFELANTLEDLAPFPTKTLPVLQQCAARLDAHGRFNDWLSQIVAPTQPQ